MINCPICQGSSYLAKYGYIDDLVSCHYCNGGKLDHSNALTVRFYGMSVKDITPANRVFGWQSRTEPYFIGHLFYIRGKFSMKTNVGSSWKSFENWCETWVEVTAYPSQFCSNIKILSKKAIFFDRIFSNTSNENYNISLEETLKRDKDNRLKLLSL